MAYQFDSSSDEEAALSAFNSDENFDPSSAGSTCPPSNGATNGVGTWSNSQYPADSEQALECYTAQGSNSSGPFPVYVWSIPTKSTFVVAAGAPNSSATDLNAWWMSNGGPFH